jgi:hypothetical protein
MTRIESIKALYKFFFGEIPSISQLERYTNFPDYIKLELINSLIISDSNYQFSSLSTTQLVKDFFKSLFNYTDDEMNNIIQEQESIALNGGVDGFSYWVNELENNSKMINMNTLAIALLNGASQTDQERVKDYLDVTNFQLEDIFNYYSNINLQYTQVATVDTYGVDTLLSGSYWNDRDTLTYSFNETIPSYYYNDEFGTELITGFTPLNENQKVVVRNILEKLSSVIDLTFIEVESIGNMKFSIIDMDDTLAGFAYYPSETNGEIAGDVFLSDIFNTSSDEFNFSYSENSFSWDTIVHEIGHALGLKHPFEEGATLSKDLDNITYSIMSYTSKFNSIPQWELSNGNLIINYKEVFPNLLAIFDLSTLQAIYGENSQSNSDDTIYTFNFYDYTFETIWDTGGVDTIELSSNYGNTTFDMRDGSINSVDVRTLSELISLYESGINNTYLKNLFEDAVTLKYKQDLLYTGENNISIAVGTIIENINTGFGSDAVVDNEYNNIINTNSSNDNIYLGNGGYDIVDGGSGIDKIFLDLEKNDVKIEKLDDSYLLTSDSFAVEFKNIELISFADNSFYSPENLLI